MQWNDAETIGLDLLKKHNLFTIYTLKEGNLASNQAYCSYKDHSITFNRRFVRAATPEHFTQVMLHEIAHAMLGPGHGHGKLWKYTARSIGYTGERLGYTPLEQLKRIMPDVEAEALFAQMQTGLMPTPLPVGTRVVTIQGWHGRIVDVKRVNYHVKVGNSIYRTRFSHAIKVDEPKFVNSPSSGFYLSVAERPFYETWVPTIDNTRKTTTAF